MDRSVLWAKTNHVCINIVPVLTSLLFVVLTGCGRGVEAKLFQAHFADPPALSARNAPSGVTPSLEREEEILAASREAGIEEPVLPSSSDSEGARLHQAEATFPLEEGECRVTYFIYASEDTIYSLWIEACPQVDGLYTKEAVRIYPSTTTREEIKADLPTPAAG